MKTYNKIASIILAAAMTASVGVCSVSAASPSELVNAKLASSGSSYTVEDIAASSDSTVSLIEEAAAAYKSYANYLINTDELAETLSDNGEGSGTIISRVNNAKSMNFTTKANFGESLASFAARGLSNVYTLTDEDVIGGVENEDAVASYVSSLITGDAKVYISDVVTLPTLEADGSYTGAGTAMRFVYIAY